MRELDFGPEPMRLVVDWGEDGDRIQAEQEVKIKHKQQSDKLQTPIDYEQHKPRQCPQ